MERKKNKINKIKVAKENTKTFSSSSQASSKENEKILRKYQIP